MRLVTQEDIDMEMSYARSCNNLGTNIIKHSCNFCGEDTPSWMPSVVKRLEHPMCERCMDVFEKSIIASFQADRKSRVK